MWSMNMGSIPATPHSSTVPFPTLSAITQLQHKWVCDPNVSVCKTAPLPVKLSEPSTDEEFCKACSIHEEIQETTDPSTMT